MRGFDDVPPQGGGTRGMAGRRGNRTDPACHRLDSPEDLPSLPARWPATPKPTRRTLPRRVRLVFVVFLVCLVSLVVHFVNTAVAPVNVVTVTRRPSVSRVTAPSRSVL